MVNNEIVEIVSKSTDGKEKLYLNCNENMQEKREQHNALVNKTLKQNVKGRDRKFVERESNS